MLKKRLIRFAIVVCVCLVVLVVVIYTPDTPLPTLKEKYEYVNSRYLQHEGMDVHYRDMGQGQTIVLLHGTSSSLHTWDEWAKLLQQNYRVVSIDLPAFGLTGPFVQHQDYSTGAYVKWMHGVFEKLNVGHAILAGNSFGGHLAWRYAARFPELVKGLVLISPSGFPLESLTTKGFRLVASSYVGWIAKYVTPFYIVRDSIRNVYGDKSKVNDELVHRYRDLTLRPGNREALILRFRALRWGHTDLLSKVKAPVLLMWGTEDALIPYAEHSRHFQQALPQAQLISYPGIGHMAMEEIPAQTVADVMPFLDATSSQ